MNRPTHPSSIFSESRSVFLLFFLKKLLLVSESLKNAHLTIIKNNVTNEIIIEIEWIDDRQNDGEDTKIGIIENSEIKIPMTVYVSQYLGETIE